MKYIAVNDLIKLAECADSDLAKQGNNARFTLSQAVLLLAGYTGVATEVIPVEFIKEHKNELVEAEDAYDPAEFKIRVNEIDELLCSWGQERCA